VRFARWAFLLAGIYGLVVTIPPFFLEEQFGRDNPPAINHPEFYYGFFGVTLAWQLMFLVIAVDPKRYRLAMLPAMVEKASFAIAIPILYVQERVNFTTLALSLIDAMWLVLFLIAFARTLKETR
jgi:hypothetical protein